MKRIFYIFIGVWFLLLSMVSTGNAIGAQPLDMKITGKPGETVPIKFTLSSTEKKAVTVKLSLAHPVQMLDGSLDFKPADPETFPEMKWININDTNVVVPPGEERSVTGNIKIPLNSKGFHMFSVLAEQPPDEKATGLFLSVVYAIRIELNIDTPTPRTIAELSDFQMVRGPKGEPWIQFTGKNTSLLQYATNASVNIRNNINKKLVEKVQLKPAFYWNNRYEPVIIPNSTVQYIGMPKEALLPGKYDLQLFFRYATSGQILLSKTVEINKGDYDYPVEKLRMVRVDPTGISITGKPGTVAVKGIKLENKSDKLLKIKLKTMELNTDYPYSVFKNMKVEFKNEPEYSLEPGRMVVAVLTVRFPKDLPAQGNYGLIKVMSYTSDNNPDPIEESYITLEAVVNGNYHFAAAATDISTNRNNDGKLLLSTVIKNTGNIKIAPHCTILLKDKNGKMVDTVGLAAQSDDDSVLPTKLMTLSGNTNLKLMPGKYKAEVKIIQGDKVIGSSFLDLQVK